jgi:hypothetical protein
MDCGLLGQETIAIFRIVAKIDNVTTDNDEYSVHYDQNWDQSTGSTSTSNTTSSTHNVVSTTTHGGYKVGQKKVVQFQHVYTEIRSYDVTLTATIVAPNLPYIHNVQHSANYTIAMSDVLCFTTTGMSDSKNDTTRTNQNNDNNIFAIDDDFVPPPAPSTIDVQNASLTETGETPSSSSSRMMVPFRAVPLVMVVLFLNGWECFLQSLY